MGTVHDFVAYKQRKSGQVLPDWVFDRQDRQLAAVVNLYNQLWNVISPENERDIMMELVGWGKRRNVKVSSTGFTWEVWA